MAGAERATLATESRSTPHHNSLHDPVATSELLGVTRGTLAGWRCTQRYDLPFVKIGRVIRYRESDIQNFLEQHTVRQSSGTEGGGR
jgi:predicted DNA-binding transcriptional regulator AlpA